MNKIKSILIALFASATAVMTLTIGAMAAMETPASIEVTPDTYEYQHSTNVVEDYKETFNELDYTQFTVEGNSATLKAKSSSYNHNMKYVWVRIVNTNDKSSLNYGAKALSSCSITTKYEGTIQSGRYIGSTYAGDTMAGLLTEYTIDIKRN